MTSNDDTRDPFNLKPATEGNLPAPTDGVSRDRTNERPKDGTSWRERLNKASDFAGKAAKAGSEAFQAAQQKAQEKAERRAREFEKQQEEKRKQQEAERRAKTEARRQRAEQIRQEREQQRIADIRKAMSRNISTGGAGTPYIVIDVVQAFANTGGTGTGEAPRPGQAFEEVKDLLWAQCQYLGGDAVLFCKYEWHKDIATFKNTGAVIGNALVNIVGMASRSGIQGNAAETRSETIVTLWGYGTVVKMLPTDQPAQPDDYAHWEEKSAIFENLTPLPNR